MRFQSQGSRFRVQGLGLRVRRFQGQGSRFRVQGLELKILEITIRVRKLLI
jgi:hypothetical protein